jgi:uncharacterized membrane protein (UPF0136 family)
MGYWKKGSKVSLLAGVACGGMLLGSGYMIAKTEHIYQAHVLATGSSGVLALAMGRNYVKTRTLLPAGLVAVVGAAACAYNYQKALAWAPTSTAK